MARTNAGASLFPTAPPTPGLRVAVVALENSLDKSLTYIVPKVFAPTIAIGQRVKVPLGRANKPAHGYVVELPAVGSPLPQGIAEEKLKRLLAIDDERVLITPNLMELARWMARYYVTPLGTVLDTIIPAAVKKRIGMGYMTLARVAIPREQLQGLVETTKQPKRRALYARLLQLADEEEIELHKLAADANVKLPTARKLATAGVIAVRSVPDLPKLNAEEPPGIPGTTPVDMPLNEDQRKVFDAFLPKLSAGFSTTLLAGVTGSGKTEIYLQSARKVLEAGKRAIILVPEIALTPQTVKRFMDRFPAPYRVAHLHSGLSATARHKQWQTVLAGKADVVVGARSAIFAPISNLGLIVVDEEHDSSYKQDKIPRYHGRDLAIKRGQLEKCAVLLASATPSLESYLRAKSAPRRHGDAEQAAENASKHSLDSDLPVPFQPSSPPTSASPRLRGESGSLLELPRRVRSLAMPAVELIDMKQEMRLRQHPHLFSARLEHLLRATLDKGEQAIILLNRRGYSNFVYCAHCKAPMHCKYCDVTLTYHRNHAEGEKVQPLGASHRAAIHTGQLHCHYCLAVQALPTTCPTCNKLLSLFGLGTQKVEEELVKRIPNVRYARVDSDTMRSAKDYESILDRFGNGELQVLLGTQMLAKGLDYPNVTLVGVISADTALALPDFRAGERTFQLLTQVAGRAGRGDRPGRVIIQTFLPDDPTIQLAIKHDYTTFATTELSQREEFGLPPFSRQARIIIRDQEEEKLQLEAARIADGITLAANGDPDLRILGPMPCPINRLQGYHRAQVQLSAPTPQPIQRVLAVAREQGLFKNADRVAIDVDPVSLL